MWLTKLADSKRSMKLALATVVLLALLVTVSFVYSWSRKSETDGKSDRINSDVSENKEIVNKIKRSLADDAVYGPSGLESDVDDTRDVDVHDRRELLGEAESEVDCLDGYPCRQKRSVTNGDMPEIMTLPNTKNEHSKNGTSGEANDENSKSGTSDEVKSKDDSVEDSSETNDEDDNGEDEDDDEDNSSVLHDGDSPIKVHRRSYSSEYDPTELENFLKNQYQDMEEEEDFADKYKREANGDGAEDGSDDDEDNIEGMEENEPGDEGNENNDNERTRRETGSSFHHVEEELDKPYQEDESVVSDQLEEEMYNPPYNLVSSDKRRRKRSAASSPDDDDEEESQNDDADDDDDSEGESDDESDNSMTKRDLDEIDNESNDENDDGESDVDDDVETEYNEQRYQRDAEDDDDDDDEIEEENGNDGSDEDTGDKNDGDDASNTDSNDYKQQQKRTTDDQLSELGDDDFKPVSSIRKARSLEYPNEPEASDSMAYDETDRDPNSGYTQWEYWGACSVTCGVGRSVRRRTCNDERYCQSGDYEERVCFPESCATDDDKK